MTPEDIKRYEKLAYQYVELRDKPDRTEFEEYRLNKLRKITAPYRDYLKKYFNEKYGWIIE